MSRLLLYLLLVVAQQGCSINSSVVATLDDYDEIMVGHVTQRVMFGRSEFVVKGENTGLSCEGIALPPYAVSSNFTYAGMVGRGNAECNDGRTVKFKWVSDSFTQYHGEGVDSVGNVFYFVSGMDEAEAKVYLQQKRAEVSNKPALPLYNSNVARKKYGYSTGTGFSVTDNGIIITSYHVIEDASSIHVFNVENEKIPAKVLFADPDNDIAVIKIEAESEAIPLADHFASDKGDEIFALGYPLNSKQAQKQKITFGHIYSLLGSEDDDRMVQINVPIQPGNSGGPLLNRKGEVIGMVTTSLDEVLHSRASGSLPPNINMAIKIDYILPALKFGKSELIQISDDDTEEMNLAHIVKIRESSVFHVIAE